MHYWIRLSVKVMKRAEHFALGETAGYIAVGVPTDERHKKFLFLEKIKLSQGW